MAGSFFDTNVLAYLASADAAKADRAESLVARGGTISVQVLNELANVARRKMQLSWAETRVLLEAVRALMAVEPLTVEVHDRGLALAERHGFSLYDAMIAAAAMEAGCDIIWTEDFQDGMRLDGGMQIRNPFGSSA